MINKVQSWKILNIAKEAGIKILEIYQEKDFSKITDFKADDSPLTLADKSAHEIIEKLLLQLFPDIPILSEEGKSIPFETRKNWQYYWCVDPLDGTKEFIKRNGEFTVNIALIHQGVPVFGVIHVPVTGESFWNEPGVGAFRMDTKEKKDGIEVNDFSPNDVGLRMVCSRSHLSPEVEAYIEKFKEPEKTSMGSSLKFMLLAQGRAEIYPRLAPTMEWDTAAAQAILVEAGGSVINHETGKALEYNKENLLNPWFVAAGKVDGNLPN